MSWRAGAAIFIDAWDSMLDNMPDPQLREEFAAELLVTFLDWDTATDGLHGDPTLDRICERAETLLAQRRDGTANS